MIKNQIDFGGKKFEATFDYVAKQANGSVVVQLGETVVLATATLGRERPDIDFFPLLVDYEERLYAAGKIKSSRFMKREGKAADEAILTGRLIDRAIRPLFDDDTRNDVQVVLTVLSVDEENDADIVAMNAASLALSVSDIPFSGPIASVRVGKINGEYIINPTYAQRKDSSLDIVVSGTGEHIIMVEAGASQAPEQDIIESFAAAQVEIKKMVAFQKEVMAKIGKPKMEVARFTLREEIKEVIKKHEDKLVTALYDSVDKAARELAITEVKKAAIEEVKAQFADDSRAELEGKVAFEKMMKKIIKGNILENERRVDGRPLNKTRQVSAEVSILPRTHGSAIFNRGETQVLTTVTLGSPGDEQILDGMEDFVETRKRYMHHYNMPGFASGEVAPSRGPGRREIGHGALAERALETVIPSKEAFPYTIRLVSEVLSSNGSTSMASTCGSTLALMDAGVPISAPIGGVAMGLVLDIESGKYKVLTDIQGIEDGNGDMDFKVTGSEAGITALQMDVKSRGITVEILTDAVKQARDGRLHILSAMKEAIAEPRAEMSKYAPRIISFKIDPEKIGTVIGSGGKTINEIVAQTGVKIDIEDDGLVMITGTDSAQSKRAEEWVKNLVREVMVGEEFQGTVMRLMDFGAFVEVLPGKEGLVHVSKLTADRVENVSDVVKVGDILDVIVTEIDSQGRINLITRAAKEAGKTDERPERRERSGGDRNGGSRFGGGGRRDGGRDRGPRR